MYLCDSADLNYETSMRQFKTFRAALTVIGFCLVAGMAHAQETAPSDPSAGDEVKPATEFSGVEPIAPYDDKLLRLAEVLGSVHYLRNLCGANEPEQWRDIMSKLIDAEKPGPQRKARLIARFNRGYRAFDESYTTCTQSAIIASERYMKEGAELAGQITARYGR